MEEKKELQLISLILNQTKVINEALSTINMLAQIVQKNSEDIAMLIENNEKENYNYD